MNEIREVAKAYYHGRGEKEKELARQFFKSLDADNNNVVCLQEYTKYVKSSLSSDDEVFRLLDKNGDKTLDFNEVLALYYMDKVSIPRCKACHKLLLASYFSCLRCLGKPSYNVCCNCYGGGGYEHHHASGEFADTRALLTMLDQIMEKADQVPKACGEDPNNREKNDADQENGAKRSTSRSKSERALETLDALNAVLVLGGTAVTVVGAVAVAPACIIM